MDNTVKCENWRSWCRLCAKTDAVVHTGVLFNNIYADSQSNKMLLGKNLSTITVAIERYFFVQLNQNVTIDEELPRLLCTNCMSFIISLENFAERVSRVQQMFDFCKSTTGNIDSHAVRVKFGVLDGEHFVLTKQLKPEVHILEAKIQAAIPQEKNSTIILETEDPLNIQSQIKTDQLEDIVAIKSEIKKKVDNDKKPVSLIHSWDRCAKTEEQKPSKKTKNQNTRKASKSKSVNTDSDALHTCTECHKKYKYIYQHMKRSHSIILPPGEYPCGECDLVFNKNSRLKDHMKVHTPIELRRNIPCKYCDKKFISNFKANRHMRHTHLNERYFMCEECGLELCSSGSLRTHMFIHSGLNPFKCELCGKGFKEKNKLNLHMDVHNNTTFACPHCGREFKTRILLRHHLPSHSDVKRFKCNFCESSFKRASTLKAHLIMHTGLKMFNCNFCDRTFSTGSSCRLHKKTMHPEELAAFEAAGEAPPIHNIPTLTALRAMKKPPYL